jgi:putative DNA primase/helicase
MNNFELENLEEKLDSTIYFVENKFKAPLLAGNIIFHFFDIDGKNQVNRGFLVMKDNKQIYRFNGSHYEDDGEEFIKDMCQKVLRIRSNRIYKNEVVEWVKDNAEIQVNRDIFNTNPYVINLENGAYNIKKNEFEEHNQSYFFNYQLPIRYDPDAEIDEIKKFLESTLYLEDIPVIQELVGYCLFKPYFIHKAFMFVGEGRNGKSTLLRLIAELLGKENIAAVPLQRICKDKFAASELYGKHANLCSELSEEALHNTGLFKQVTGGDYIRAEKKIKDGFKFINTAKLIFSCNVIPESKDKTSAYFDRWIVIEFPNVFNEENEDTDKHILEKLTTEKELSGFFNWAIEGLNRLLVNNDFSKHRTLEDVKEYMAERKNPVYLFISTYIESNPESELTKHEVYEKFLEFCRFNGFPTIASNHLSQKLKQYAPFKIGEGQSRIKKAKTWKGIKFKEKDAEIKQDVIFSENK